MEASTIHNNWVAGGTANGGSLQPVMFDAGLMMLTEWAGSSFVVFFPGVGHA